MSPQPIPTNKSVADRGEVNTPDGTRVDKPIDLRVSAAETAPDAVGTFLIKNIDVDTNPDAGPTIAMLRVFITQWLRHHAKEVLELHFNPVSEHDLVGGHGDAGLFVAALRSLHPTKDGTPLATLPLELELARSAATIVVDGQRRIALRISEDLVDFGGRLVWSIEDVM